MRARARMLNNTYSVSRDRAEKQHAAIDMMDARMIVAGLSRRNRHALATAILAARNA